MQVSRLDWSVEEGHLPLEIQLARFVGLSTDFSPHILVSKHMLIKMLLVEDAPIFFTPLSAKVNKLPPKGPGLQCLFFLKSA